MWILAQWQFIIFFSQVQIPDSSFVIFTNLGSYVYSKYPGPHCFNVYPWFDFVYLFILCISFPISESSKLPIVHEISQSLIQDVRRGCFNNASKCNKSGRTCSKRAAMRILFTGLWRRISCFSVYNKKWLIRECECLSEGVFIQFSLNTLTVVTGQSVNGNQTTAFQCRVSAQKDKHPTCLLVLWTQTRFFLLFFMFQVVSRLTWSSLLTAALFHTVLCRSARWKWSFSPGRISLWQRRDWGCVLNCCVRWEALRVPGSLCV